MCCRNRVSEAEATHPRHSPGKAKSRDKTVPKKQTRHPLAALRHRPIHSSSAPESPAYVLQEQVPHKGAKHNLAESAWYSTDHCPYARIQTLYVRIPSPCNERKGGGTAAPCSWPCPSISRFPRRHCRPAARIPPRAEGTTSTPQQSQVADLAAAPTYHLAQIQPLSRFRCLAS